MNTKLLKQKILDLAIRGKLTQQLKSDGTAADLLKQISEQKRESSSTLSSPRRRGSPSAQSEKTIIPLDKNEAPFEIPANWEWVRLGDIGKWQSGTTPSKSNSTYYKDGTIPWLNTGDLNDGIINDIPKRVTEKALAETSLRLNEAGSVCIAMYGATIGKLGILSMPATTNQACCVCNNLKSFVNRMWLFYFLMNHKQEFIEAGFGGAQPNISKEKIVSTIFPLPPLAEQRRIVEKIQEAFAEIDSIEKNKELLKNHIKQARQKILDLAIHGKLVPQNKTDEPASVLLERITRDNPHYEKIEDEPFEIPENWAWCRLGNICDKLIDGDHNPPKGLDYTTEYMMLSSRNINDNGIVDLENVRYLSKDTFEEGNLRTKLEKGDILFTSVGSLGRSCVFSGDGKYCFQRSVSVIHTSIYNKYLKYFFDSNYYQKYIVENATGTAQLGFYLEQMRKSFIAIPPFNEQSRIVAKIEELFSTLDQMERNLV